MLGAFGYFEVTHDITQLCKAAVFSQVGKRTPVAVRFSTVAGELGSADTVRDVRGFAIKFYTEEGNWDIVGNNTPIFFLRDPILFPSFIHTRKRNPVTSLKVHIMIVTGNSTSCTAFVLCIYCYPPHCVTTCVGSGYVLGYTNFTTGEHASTFVRLLRPRHPRWLPIHERTRIAHFQVGQRPRPPGLLQIPL